MASSYPKVLQNLIQKTKPQLSLTGVLLFWWAHQDLNLGPKDWGFIAPKYFLGE
jgi:hypothetical protein